MIDIISDCYRPLLKEHGFIPAPANNKFGPSWTCWQLSPEVGEGFYWIYAQKDLFDIKVHDFYFHKDSFLEFNFPKCLSITQYNSISGEESSPCEKESSPYEKEFSPCKSLSAGCIKAFIGGYQPYKVLIHKKVPIRSIGIQIMPAYYEDYLKRQYPGEYISMLETFRQFDQAPDFPEMARVLHQVMTYRGNGIAANLFYEGKVAEAVSLIASYRQRKDIISEKRLSGQDINQLAAVKAYLNEHYAFDIPLDSLAKISYMGTTKLKSAFKQAYNCTITEYIQQQRISHAELLLESTELTIGEVAKTVGYGSASRFAELFRRSTGLLPGEYRKIAR